MAAEYRNGNLVENPNYQVIIKRPAEQDLPEITIKANLPESFSFGVTASYATRLPVSLNAGEAAAGVAGVVSSGAENIIRQAARGAEVFARTSRVFQLMSHQVWEGSSPISFSIPLLFDAVDDAERDVLLPIKQLMSLALPFKGNSSAFGVNTNVVDNWLLKPPGPVLSNPNYGRVSLQIGNMNYFHSVLINDVNVTFDTRMTENGAPISASVDLSVVTVNTPTQDDIEKFFMSTDKAGNKVKDDTYGVKYGPIEDVKNVIRSAGIDIGQDENIEVDVLGDNQSSSTYLLENGLSPSELFDGSQE